MSADHLLRTELIADELCGLLGEFGCVFGIPLHSQQAAGYFRSGSDRKQGSGFAVADQFPIGVDVAGCTGNSGGHGFHQAVGHAFEFAGQYERVQCGQQLSGIFTVAGEDNFAAAVEACQQLSESRLVRPASDQNQLRILDHLMQQLKGPDQIRFQVIDNDESPEGREVDNYGTPGSPLVIDDKSILFGCEKRLCSAGNASTTPKLMNGAILDGVKDGAIHQFWGG